jgi:hypothetical protein
MGGVGKSFKDDRKKTRTAQATKNSADNQGDFWKFFFTTKGLARRSRNHSKWRGVAKE